jgi:hypothetical protein
MAINLTTKYSSLIAERFKDQSITDAYAGKKYDFDGAQSIKIYTVDKVGLNDYSRTAAGGRFGTVAELGDTIQTLTMSQDKAFTFSIDHGNSADQLNIKHANEQLKSNWDEVVTPAIDQYRFSKWANGAGLGAGATLSASTVMTAIMTANAALSNKMVPKKNRVLFISESVYIVTKLSTEVLALPNLGDKAVANGVVGTIDGVSVVPVPDSLLPTGVNFIIKYKDSTVDPMKLKTLRVQKNPIGYDADVGECRFYHDSFVIGAKVNGLYCHALAANTLPAPTLTNAANSVTFACAGSTGIKYTLDGTDPKTAASPTTVLAASYATPVVLTAGQVMRAYGYAAGKINSPITETAYA